MSYNAKNYTEQGGETTHIGGKLEFGEGAQVSGFPYDKAASNKLGAVKVGAGLEATSAGVLSVKPATDAALGGVKVGDGLQANSAGVLSVKPAAADALGGVKLAANQAASTAADVAGVVADLNTLLASLKAAGIMVADASE